MRAKTLLTILFLLSLGVAAWLFLHALPQNATADVQPTPKEEVLVAAGPLAAGTLLRSEDVVWRPAAGVVEPGTVVRPLAAVLTEGDEPARNEVSGAALNVDLARGEPIRRSLIVKPGDREFLQVELTSGARAIAIPISSVGAGTGLLNPGDRVDVVLTQNFNSEGLARRSVSETIAQNLRMLAIDPPNAQGGRSVMLEVTPEQAEKVGVAAELVNCRCCCAVPAIPRRSAAQRTTAPARLGPATCPPPWRRSSRPIRPLRSIVRRSASSAATRPRR